MRLFNYVVQDQVGIHARPASLLVKEAGKYQSDITLICGDRSSSAKKLMAVMSLGVKQGMEVTVKLEGSDEELASKELEKFFTENL